MVSERPGAEQSENNAFSHCRARSKVRKNRFRIVFEKNGTLTFCLFRESSGMISKFGAALCRAVIAIMILRDLNHVGLFVLVN